MKHLLIFMIILVFFLDTAELEFIEAIAKAI